MLLFHNIFINKDYFCQKIYWSFAWPPGPPRGGVGVASLSPHLPSAYLLYFFLLPGFIVLCFVHCGSQSEWELSLAPPTFVLLQGI